jgi:hypothetical protein
MPSRTIPDLRAILTEVLSESPGRAATAEFVSFCHSLALLYLRRKTAAGWLGGRFLGMPLEDIALDCVAPLFERSERGSFVGLQKYFTEADVAAGTQFFLTALTRRLVFSKVNQELVAQLREEDPGLARITRNIRLAVKSHARLALTHDGKSATINLRSSNDSPEGVSQLPPEVLVAYMTPIMQGNPTIPRLLEELADVLASQTSHRPAIPLLQLALAIRQASVATSVEAPEVTDPDHFVAADTAVIVDDVLDTLRKQMAHTYRERKGIAADVYDAYFRALRQKFCAEFVYGNGERDSLFSYLSAEYAGLVEEEYTTKHRVVLEYLMALAKERLLLACRKEFL